MKVLNKAIAVLGALVLPVAALAQSSQPVSREQVKAEMSQLEAVGYNPASRNDASYPAEIQAAQARLSAPATAATDTTTSSYSPPIVVNH
ncbi:DUF4148 domain-containing protein [Paraburkholderia sp. RL17-383-BIF-A]|jgi:hypothetical protein|uniref:DUF4148 domain-containing protein n=1 Tax=Paraburkholderia sp. RL17-383-BIF-A TaxID=3031631 RepID=UPI0038BA5FCC